MPGSLVASVLLLALAPTANAQWFGDVSAQWQYSDNLPRSRNAADAFNDQSVSVALQGGKHLQLGNYTGLNLSGLLRSELFHQYSGMNNLEAGVGISLNHKFGLGRLAPTAALSAQLSRSRFNNAIRNSDNSTVTLSLQKRLSERFNLIASVAYDNLDGDHDLRKTYNSPVPGNAFDQRAVSGSLSAELDWTERSWLSATVKLRSGDIVSTGAAYTSLGGAAKAITLDPVFGEHAVAYRLDSRTRIYSFDYNRVFDERGTWYTGLEYQDTRGTSNIDYSVGLLRSGFIYSF